MVIRDLAGPQDPAETAKIKTTASDAWHATVALFGEFDMAAAPALRTALDRHFYAGRCCVRIDAAGVTFLDATALNVLVTAAQRWASVRGALILTNVPTRVRQIIRITRLETVLLIDTACDGQERHQADLDLLDAATHSLSLLNPREAHPSYLGG